MVLIMPLENYLKKLTAAAIKMSMREQGWSHPFSPGAWGVYTCAL
jgi:hypothetical protein